MSEPAAAEANEDRLMTRIDGEEVRLLVHIEAIDDAGDAATSPDPAHDDEPDDPPGLAQ